MPATPCPKCGAPRVPEDSCPRCGVVYARYRAPADRPERSPAGAGGKALVGLILVGSLVLAGVWWWSQRGIVELPDEPLVDAVIDAPAPDGPVGDVMDRLDPQGLLSGGSEPELRDASVDAQALDAAGGDSDLLQHDGARGRFFARLPSRHSPVQQRERALKSDGEPMAWSGYRARTKDQASPVLEYMLWHYDVAPFVLEGQEEETWLRGMAQDALHQLGQVEIDEGSFSNATERWLRLDFSGTVGARPVGGRILIARVTPRDVVLLQAVGKDQAAGISPEAVAFFQSFGHDAAGTPSAGTGCRQAASHTTRITQVAPGDIPRRVRRSAGCAVLFEYYAGWCPACRGAMPNVTELADRWRPHGLAVYAFADSDGTAQLQQMIDQVKPSYEPLQIGPAEDGEVTAAIDSLGGSYPGKIPYFALFDTRGQLVVEGSGTRALDEIEDRLPGLLR